MYKLIPMFIQTLKTCLIIQLKNIRKKNILEKEENTNGKTLY